MTKAERIRTLYAAGKSIREIADIIGCSDSYVRVAARQRTNGSSKHDRAYLKKMKDLVRRYGDYEFARQVGRSVYEQTGDWSKYCGAHSNELRKSARRNAAAFAKA